MRRNCAARRGAPAAFDPSRREAINPHIKFLNNQRGSVRHIVRPERWQADFRVVDKVSVPDSPIRTRKSLVTELGRPGIVEA